jgi:hypothetical protein
MPLSSPLEVSVADSGGVVLCAGLALRCSSSRIADGLCCSHGFTLAQLTLPWA